MPYADLDLYCKVYYVRCSLYLNLLIHFPMCHALCLSGMVFFPSRVPDLGGHAHIRWGVHMCPICLFVNVLLIYVSYISIIYCHEKGQNKQPQRTFFRLTRRHSQKVVLIIACYFVLPLWRAVAVLIALSLFFSNHTATTHAAETIISSSTTSSMCIFRFSSRRG